MFATGIWGFLLLLLFNLFNIQLVKLVWSLKDDGYCYYNLMASGNISFPSSYFFEDRGLRLDLSR